MSTPKIFWLQLILLDIAFKGLKVKQSKEFEVPKWTRGGLIVDLPAIMQKIMEYLREKEYAPKV
jgi:hypothetical protein